MDMKPILCIFNFFKNNSFNFCIKTEKLTTAYLNKNLFTLVFIEIKIMFGFFKSDPVKKLEKEYLHLMKKGRDAQRNGDLHAYGRFVFEAESVMAKINEIQAKRKGLK